MANFSSDDESTYLQTSNTLGSPSDSGSDFEVKSVNFSIELDHDGTESDETPVEIDDNANDNIELKKELKTEQVKEALQLINDACCLSQKDLWHFNKTWLTKEKSKNKNYTPLEITRQKLITVFFVLQDVIVKKNPPSLSLIVTRSEKPYNSNHLQMLTTLE